MPETDLSRQFAQVAADAGPAVATAQRDDLLASLAAVAALAFGAELASIALYDEDSGELEFVASSRGPSDPIIGVRMPITRGIAGWCASSGQVVVVDDVTRDDRFARDVAEQLGYVPKAILAAPVESDEGVIGVLEVLDPVGGTRDMQLAGTLANHAAQVLLASTAASDLAHVLFAAAARATDGDLSASLQDLAAQGPGPRAELAELAAAFSQLGRLGSREQAAATRLVTHFLEYASR